jgi:hypothetical protein
MYSPVGPALLAENQAKEKLLSIFILRELDNSFQNLMVSDAMRSHCRLISGVSDLMKQFQK